MADLVHLSSSASSEEIIDVLNKDAGVIIDNLLHSDDISRINQDLKPYLKIDVFATPLFDEKKQFSPALSTSIMEGNYQSILRLEKKGFWLLDFEINDGQKKTIISEQIEIFERNRTIGNSDFSYAFLIIQFIFFGGIIYLFISSRIRKKKLNI